MNKNNRVVSLPPAGLPMMKDGNVEEIKDGTATGSVVELSSAGKIS